MTIAVYAGSFDPITNGHLNILKKSTEIFDKVIIAVAKNINKTEFLTVEERIELIKEAVKNIKNVEVDFYDGLTVNYAKTKGANILVRGLRNSSDFEYENELAQINSTICPDIKTIFFIADNKYSFISSSAVREIYKNKGNFSEFVPNNVKDYLTKHEF